MLFLVSLVFMKRRPTAVRGMRGAEQAVLEAVLLWHAIHPCPLIRVSS